MVKELDFEKITNSLDAGVLIIDSAWHISYVNDWIYDRSGLTPDQVINQKLTDVFPDLAKSRLIDCCREALDHSMPSRLSNTFNPTPFPLYEPENIGNEFFRLQQMVLIKPQKTKGTHSERLCEIIIADVTSIVIKESLLKRMAMERDLDAKLRAEERNHLQRIIDNTGDAILSFSPGELIDHSNPGAERLFAMSREELSQATFEQLLAQSCTTQGMAAERIGLYISQSIANKKAGETSFIADIINRNGVETPIEIKFSAVETGQKLSIVAVLRDLSSQIKVERVLKENEIRYKTLAKVAPVGIFEVDLEGICTYANSTWFQITRQPESSLQRLNWLNIVTEADREKSREAWKRCLYSNHSESFEFRIESKGTETWVLCQIMSNTDTKGSICGFIGTLTDISEQRQSQQRIEELAYYDPLTNLANRRLFKDRLNQAISSSKRAKTSFAMLALDLDEFKNVNDTLGHDVGDALLIEVAKRLRSIVRESDTIARIGGDEFSILLNPVNNTDDIATVAKKIIHSIQLPFYIAGEVQKISTSIGASVYPTDGNNAQLLIKNADIAMYVAKDAGKNRAAFYSVEMNAEAEYRRLLEKNLREVIDQKRFELYFQPQVDLNQGHILGAEVLLRWIDEHGNIQSPIPIIEVAESTGLMKPLGRLILHRSFAHLRELLDQKLVPEHFTLAVNISAKQFLTPSLLFDIWELMNKFSIPGKNVELEITESVWLKEYDIADKIIQCLKSFDISVSVDDFGTGFSSLSYLYKLPIDKIKIDQSFIADLKKNERAEDIINTITAVATKLSMEVIAEGIEDQQQLSTLLSLNCTMGQGYLLSKPLTFQGFVKYLQEFSLRDQQKRMCLIK